jgi:transposase
VVRPRDWDQYGQKVKTDKRDARELALALDRYVSGNRAAFTVIRVPTEAEEQRRSLARQRQALQTHKQRLAAQGRGHALYYGHRLQGEWWTQRLWAERQATLPFIVVKLLTPLRALILATDAALSVLTDEVAGAHRGPLPLGVGELTAETLEREIANWNRFKNRRQVASYTGLCPSEDSSGPQRFQGHINKHGNRRLRPLLIELMWRLTVFQPEYRVVKRWRPQLLAPKASGSRRKQIIVAMARAFSVDWWRLRTGRTTPEKLGLRLKGSTAAQSKRQPTET